VYQLYRLATPDESGRVKGDILDFGFVLLGFAWMLILTARSHLRRGTLGARHGFH
jgi:hypothetical protein